MQKLPIGQIEKLGLNRYEAVIVASQHARSLNNRRLRSLEKMEENPLVEIEARKITMVALKDLLDGNVKFTRADSM
ncbi:MAG: DNA-directed RNA polymerase subunit omega [Candidatus Zixiibacteriota bacterium]|nr:MAG: DNA-directed RNA polymerase subunit omega [candidate division Zixibacteria bacterium]